MKTGYKHLLLSLAVLIILLGGFLARNPAQIAHALSSLSPGATTNNLLASTSPFYASRIATTSPMCMTAGTATTTLVLSTQTIDQVGVNVLLQASSTLSILQWNIDYSSNAVDWYSDDIALATSTNATQSFSFYNWKFASSTGGTSNGGINNYKHFNIFNVASPYTRIVFSAPIGSDKECIVVSTQLKQNNSI